MQEKERRKEKKMKWKTEFIQSRTFAKVFHNQSSVGTVMPLVKITNA